MMLAIPRVETVGLPSRGASGNPGPFEMLPGVTVWSSRWVDMSPKGEVSEGAGIKPKVVVDATPLEYRDGDPTLSAALDLLR
jgi:hypothetical protein